MADNFLEYLKCGDVLLAPSSLYKVQYALKCSECEEHYSILETFLQHCATHFERDLLVCVSSGTVDRGTEQDDITHTQEADPLTFFKLDIKADEEFIDDNEPINQDYAKNTDSEDDQNEYINEPDNDFADSSADSQNDKMLFSENLASTSGGRIPLSTPFVETFLKSNVKVVTFIDAYKNQPYLWNTTVVSHNPSREREKYLQNIANEVKEKIDLQLTSDQVMSLIKRLRRDYKLHLAQLEKQEDSEAPSSPNKTFKYSDKLEFLKHLVQINAMTYLDTLRPNLTMQEVIQILGIYKRFPHLWNSDLIEYVCKNKRTEALEQLQNVLESEMGIKTSHEILERYFYSLHFHLSREKRYDLDNLASTAGRSKYYEHMMFLLDHVTPAKCDQCNLKYQSPLTLKVHKTKHDGLLHLKCSLCNKEYKNVAPYTAHARRHMNDFKSECKECGKKFMRQADLHIHMRSHTGEKQYCCDICGLKVAYSNMLRAHRRTHKKILTHFCQYCSKGFYAKDKLTIHLKFHTTTRDFTCDICGKTFKTKKCVTKHKFVHETGRNHACELCGKTFKNKLGIYHHMRTHRKLEISE